MWTVHNPPEIYVYWNGQLIFKRWLTKKRALGLLLNESWPNVFLPAEPPCHTPLSQSTNFGTKKPLLVDS